MKFSKYNLLIPGEEAGRYYLFNTFNGSCIEVEESIANAVKNSYIDELDKETKDLFKHTGVLLPLHIDETKVFSYMRDVEKHNPYTLSSTVLLTWACNLRCTYCFQGHENRSVSMSFEQADRYIEFLTKGAKYKGSKHIFIMLFGGEPLINIKIGYYILNKIKLFCDENKLTFSSAIITNGTLLNEATLEKLKEYNCRMIQITLDGVKEIHDRRRIYSSGQGSFDETMKALQLIDKSSDIHTVIRINIDRDNIGSTYKLLNQIGKDGLNLTKFTVDFGIVRGETGSCPGYSGKCFSESEIGDVLYDLWSASEAEGFKYDLRPMRKHLYCGLYSDNQYTIAPNGDVYKCWEHVGQKEHLMGRLADNGDLVDITYAFYDWMSVDPVKNAECRECIYLPVCGGGCGVVSYNETGTYHSTGCFKVQGTVEQLVLKFVEGVIKIKLEKEKCVTSCAINNGDNE